MPGERDTAVRRTASQRAGPDISVIVPTLGRSPWLDDSLAALRATSVRPVEIVVVDQAPEPLELAPGLADRVLRPRSDRVLGFAAANNAARTLASGRFIATVNDDAVVDRGWLDVLLEALDADAELGAVQGTNVSLERPEVIDGRGMGWNRWWQAVQLDRGRAADSAMTHRVFGVSATAAVYRREALDAVMLDARQWFDEALDTYYEDVDLAARLLAGGWPSALVAGARARHGGGASGDALGSRRGALLYGNRWLVLARLLGRRLWARLPVAMLRDVADLWQARRLGDHETAQGIRLGWRRARSRLGSFAHRGAPLVSLAALRSFRTDRS